MIREGCQCQCVHVDVQISSVLVGVHAGVHLFLSTGVHVGQTDQGSCFVLIRELWVSMCASEIMAEIVVHECVYVCMHN